MNIRIFALTVLSALAGLTAYADTPAQLHAAIGSPVGIAVLSVSDWVVSTDSSLGLAVPGSTYWNASRGWRKPGSLTVYAHWAVPKGSVSVPAVTPALDTTEQVGGLCYSGDYQDGAYVLTADDTGTSGHLVISCSAFTLSADCAFVTSEDLILVFVDDEILYLPR